MFLEPLSLKPELRGNRRVIIRPDDGGEPVTYSIPKGRYVIVNEGDYIRAGEPIMDGHLIHMIF